MLEMITGECGEMSSVNMLEVNQITVSLASSDVQFCCDSQGSVNMHLMLNSSSS